MRCYLVVGHQTLGSEELLAEMRGRAEGEPCRFHVVIPMAHPARNWTWSEGSEHAVAQARLDEALQRFRAVGLRVSGEVGDPSPVAAVGDAIITQSELDGIIVSTLSRSTSVWLSNNVVRRIAREHPAIPVIHVTPASVPVG